ncbi:MAG: ABC transporter permease, partial [Pseudomonadota bacterium]|nr:ABC transporter permease [Pseudomonadota bacterium]
QGDMIKGMEALEVTQELMDKHGLAGFGPDFAVTCENHGGPGLGAVQQWDASAGEWSLISGFEPSDKDVIDALVKEDSEAYAAENNIEARCN